MFLPKMMLKAAKNQKNKNTLVCLCNNKSICSVVSPFKGVQIGKQDSTKVWN